MAETSTDLRAFLARITPFRSMPSAEIDRLSVLSRGKNYAKGETIYSEGDLADSVWVLKTGRIQIFKYTPSGKPLAIESLGPGELFGTLCRLGSNARTYPCTAIAAVGSAVVQIADRTFLDFYNRNPALVMGVCSLCSQRLNNVQGLSCSAQEPVDKRIARMLLQLRQQHGNTLPMTKREIGELCGTTVETSIRTLSAFAKKGWVKSTRGQITLQNLPQLEKLVNEAC